MHLLSRVAPAADYRVAYGDLPCQFGDLWLPRRRTGKSSPVVVFFHGGWWKSVRDLEYGGHLCSALAEQGMACWSVEYRRVGDTGGGWPYTLQDAAAGLDYLATLAPQHSLDLSRVITMGHSAGGHLAFWAAGRSRLPEQSELETPAPRVALLGTIALAGAVDLRMTVELAGNSTFAHDRDEVHRLMGGSASEFPERYASANPGDLLPFDIPQVLFQGTGDDQIPPELPLRWQALAGEKGDRVEIQILPSADHFDVVDPESSAWPPIRDCARQFLGC